MQVFRYALHALLAFVCWFSMSASAATVYSLNDFQTAVGAGWSSTDNTIVITQAPNDDFERKFLGEFSNGTVSLSLTDLPEHATTTVSFSLYLIRSWDGNDTTVVDGDPLGPDSWSLGVAGGPTLLNTTFSNGNSVAGQRYDGAFSTYTYTPWTPCNAYADYSGPGNGPMTGANECYSLGYDFDDPNLGLQSMDSVYNLSFTFAHSADNLALNFSAAGLQGLSDESWGLDNVHVEVAAVPVPAAVWLFGSGLLGLFGLMRRR
ncbi:MAG: hypothetical protein NUV55_09315 [Sulfuricaulis sp.]|uniref:hypothetical protein n=1 Tax=Sulfuricaulis sp. TaxID=2003553 RepID=UPI0025D6B87C|nr:hypothetical protein [Sulfuricaulis sp.]MCR4347382.1 hypothetical protein [Sulfuricaulis sp.]